ncbi:YqaJ viral recombinase family protein [Mycobacterium sp. CSUR Q5927]|nr:YqaJ viral recombinase family protein [Mycobacterium sp. CSUR Q5927]
MNRTTYPDIKQGTEEWHALRRGIVTASTAGKLLTVRKLGAIDFDCPACDALAHNPCRSKRSNTEIKTLHPERAEHARSQSSATVIEPASNEDSRSLTTLLASERITGWTWPTFTSEDMWRGVESEPIVRDLYSKHYAPATQVGFMVAEGNGYRLGYSPDGLVGDEGLLEIKAPRARTHLATILADRPPVEHMPQLQAGLLVSGRQWIDYISFCGGMPLFVKRVRPDDRWFKAIRSAVASCEENIAEMQRIYDEQTADMIPTERITEDLGLVI